MQLTNENYYSKEANEEYLSVSQYNVSNLRGARNRKKIKV